MTMEKKIKIGLICFLLGGFILASGVVFAVMEAPIQDSGTFEVTVLDVFSIPGNMSWAEANQQGYYFHGDYVKLRINKMISYYHDQRADYNALSIGDEIEAMFHLGMVDWNTQEPKPVVKGDTLRVEMSNHYRTEMSNPYRGWRIFQYDIIKQSVGEVTITTDKAEYEQGERVKITIRNDLNKEKWIFSPFYTVERFNNGNLIEIKKVDCPCEVACKIAAYFVLQPYGTTEYQWDQKETWCSDQTRISKTISNQVPFGKYRIRSEISDPNEYTSKQIIYSNEFAIKRQTSSIAENIAEEENKANTILCMAIGIIILCIMLGMWKFKSRKKRQSEKE